MRKQTAITLALALLALVACGPSDTGSTPAPGPVQVNFHANVVSVRPSGEARIELGLANVGEERVPGDSFTADFQLREAGGDVRASGTAVLSPIAPNETQTVIGWDGTLEAGEYELTWGAPGLGSALVEFEIVGDEGDLRLGDVVNRYGPGYPRPDSPQGN